MDKQWIQPIDDYLGGRYLPNFLMKHLKSFERQQHCILYRGMQYPKHLLVIGSVLEEWHGSSHWSKDVNVSIGFANDGYLNEDYCSELGEEMGIESPEELFVPVVFRLKESTKGIDIHSLIQDIEELSTWHKEQEVCFIGTDFILEDVTLVEGEHIYYLVDVKEKDSIKGVV